MARKRKVDDRCMSTYNRFVRDNYNSVKDEPNKKRFSAIAKLWKSKSTKRKVNIKRK